MKTREQLIKAYIDFFKSKNHKEIPNVSLIPENDPTVLFTTAGMHPLVPYLLGQPHPQGKRLVNVQKCIRTTDIEEVGDNCHHTFLEMLGNWSLGDYFKKEAIEMTLEFLTKILKIPKQKLTITCFKGDKNAPKDTESAKIWESLGIPKQRIKFLGKDNWWGPAGKTGPCGPSTEMFVENIEIGNDVLMQYNKNRKGRFNLAKQKNIDFGGGVERTLAILQGFDDNYLTQIWQPIIKQIEKLSGKKYKGNEREMRIIADHIKASVFIIADGAVPSNTEQGYVLRRLIRRAIRYAKNLGIPKEIDLTTPLVKEILKTYKDYKHLQKNKQKIIDELNKEEDQFEKTLDQGLKQSEKIFNKKKPIQKEKFSKLMKDPNKSNLIGRIFDNKSNKKDYSLKSPRISKEEIDKASLSGKDTFLLYQSYGFPLEMVNELAMAKRLLVDHQDFKKELASHQKLSRTASAGKFKSGLADSGKQTTKLHTVTHLLNQALRQVLKKPDLFQRGSNITPERTRFDFNFDRKLTDKEKKDVEQLVNKKIKQAIPIKREEMTLEQAKNQGAQGIFDTKYGDKVSVYTIGNFSKEICAGPHISNTKELGTFKIKKEQSSSAGVRRIKAILE